MKIVPIAFRILASTLSTLGVVVIGFAAWSWSPVAGQVFVGLALIAAGFNIHLSLKDLTNAKSTS